MNIKIFLVFVFVFNSVAGAAISLETKEIYGCWINKIPKTVDDERSGGTRTLCFRKDLTAYYANIAPEGGGDDVLEWYLKRPDVLVIDDQSCLVVSYKEQHLFLSRCIYTGGWDRRCSKMNESGLDCNLDND